MNKNKNLGFTLAEVLIVIGIIGVVAALTLPNLNHATGDKETVTRLQKAYSILNEANDRAVAIYGPISSWPYECKEQLGNCWTKRVGEFLKKSKYCDETVDSDSDNYSSCDEMRKGDFYGEVIYQLPDRMIITGTGYPQDPDNICNYGPWGWNHEINDICLDEVYVDIDGPNKGKNQQGYDIFQFGISDKLGLMPAIDDENIAAEINSCVDSSPTFYAGSCTWWVLEYGNIDYLKADEEGKCNDSNIILDGVTNTSCN